MFSVSLHNEDLQIRPKVKASFKEILRPFKALTKRSDSVTLNVAEKVGKFAVLAVLQRFVRFHKVYTGFGDFAGTKSPFCELVSRLRSLAREAKTCFRLPEKALAFELVVRSAFSCDAGRLESGRKSLEADTKTQKARDNKPVRVAFATIRNRAPYAFWCPLFYLGVFQRGRLPFMLVAPSGLKSL